MMQETITIIKFTQGMITFSTVFKTIMICRLRQTKLYKLMAQGNVKDCFLIENLLQNPKTVIGVTMNVHKTKTIIESDK